MTLKISKVFQAQELFYVNFNRIITDKQKVYLMDIMTTVDMLDI